MRFYATLGLCLASLVMLVMAAAAAEPPAPTHYRGREIAQTMHYTGAPWLVRESRQRE
jgi:hypothetical protein